MTDNLTPSELIDAITSFLRVIIEQLWYQIEVYPRESFESCIFYDLEVKTTRHPLVKAYLDEFINSITNLFNDGIISKIYLEIFENNSLKYSFGISFNNSLILDQLRNDSQFLKSDKSNDLFNTFTIVNELKSLLYSVIVESSKLSKIEQNFGDFKLLLATTEDEMVSRNQNWILDKRLKQQTADDESTLNDVDLYPLKEVHLEYINIQGYIVSYK